MNIKIIKGENFHISECVSAIMNSLLGEMYFTEEYTIKDVTQAIKENLIYVALDSDNTFLGFIWVLPKNAFHHYPYIHVIAVKKEHQSKGIGSKLLEYCEDVIFPEHTKFFLTVSEFNPRAKELYEKLGYIQVGAIPNLYKHGITEYLMMKYKK